MLGIFLRRILLAIPVLIAVASITFFLVRLAPGGPFDADKAVSEQVLKNLNEAYNLNAPLSEQYFDYMSGILVGDFGPSFRFPGRSVTELIMTGLPVTFELAIYSMLIALFIGILSGVTAALKRNTFLDYIPMSIAMIGICVPTFLLGPLLVLIFGINLELLPDRQMVFNASSLHCSRKIFQSCISPYQSQEFQTTKPKPLQKPNWSVRSK